MRVNAFDTHVNLSKCAWAALPTRESSGPRADQRTHVRISGPTCEVSGPRASHRARVRAGALLPCTGSGINEKPRVRENSGRLLLRLDSNQ